MHFSSFFSLLVLQLTTQTTEWLPIALVIGIVASVSCEWSLSAAAAAAPVEFDCPSPVRQTRLWAGCWRWRVRGEGIPLIPLAFVLLALAINAFLTLMMLPVEYELWCVTSKMHFSIFSKSDLLRFLSPEGIRIHFYSRKLRKRLWHATSAPKWVPKELLRIFNVGFLPIWTSSVTEFGSMCVGTKLVPIEDVCSAKLIDRYVSFGLVHSIIGVLIRLLVSSAIANSINE